MCLTIEQLQQELFSTLKKAERNRQKVALYRFLSYGGALVYFIGIFAMQMTVSLGGDTSLFYTLNPNPTFWEQYKLLIIILPLFLLITIGGFGLSFFQQKFAEAEQASIRHIIRTMFPDATCLLSTIDFPMSLAIKSNFFGAIDREYASGYSFGSLTFNDDKQRMTFRDVLINTGKSYGWVSQSSFGGSVLVAKYIFKGLYAKRVENIPDGFRGMFAEAQLEKNINGSVVVMPDHLESRLDYLAKNIQALKNVNGNKLVTLEDVEFERYFAVYASDEITARYVLTPAMMQRMTELKRKYNRDIMLSFNGNRFYFAVAMPEGFLTLGNASLTSGEALKGLYDSIVAAQGILNDLKLK